VNILHSAVLVDCGYTNTSRFGWYRCQ